MPRPRTNVDDYRERFSGNFPGLGQATYVSGASLRLPREVYIDGVALSGAARPPAPPTPPPPAPPVVSDVDDELVDELADLIPPLVDEQFPDQPESPESPEPSDQIQIPPEQQSLPPSSVLGPIDPDLAAIEVLRRTLERGPDQTQAEDLVRAFCRDYADIGTCVEELERIRETAMGQGTRVGKIIAAIIVRVITDIGASTQVPPSEPGEGETDQPGSEPGQHAEPAPAPPAPAGGRKTRPRGARGGRPPPAEPGRGRDRPGRARPQRGRPGPRKETQIEIPKIPRVLEGFFPRPRPPRPGLPPVPSIPQPPIEVPSQAVPRPMPGEVEYAVPVPDGAESAPETTSPAPGQISEPSPSETGEPSTEAAPQTQTRPFPTAAVVASALGIAALLGLNPARAIPRSIGRAIPDTAVTPDAVATAVSPVPLTAFTPDVRTYSEQCRANEKKRREQRRAQCRAFIKIPVRAHTKKICVSDLPKYAVRNLRRQALAVLRKELESRGVPISLLRRPRRPRLPDVKIPRAPTWPKGIKIDLGDAFQTGSRR